MKKGGFCISGDVNPDIASGHDWEFPDGLVVPHCKNCNAILSRQDLVRRINATEKLTANYAFSIAQSYEKDTKTHGLLMEYTEHLRQDIGGAA